MSDDDRVAQGEMMTRVGWGAGVAVGMGVGVALGGALDNMAVGIGFGISIGVIMMIAFTVAGSRLRQQGMDAAPESGPGDAAGRNDPEGSDDIGESRPDGDR